MGSIIIYDSNKKLYLAFWPFFQGCHRMNYKLSFREKVILVFLSFYRSNRDIIE
jgi:hypothetical protein